MLVFLHQRLYPLQPEYIQSAPLFPLQIGRTTTYLCDCRPHTQRLDPELSDNQQILKILNSYHLYLTVLQHASFKQCVFPLVVSVSAKGRSWHLCGPWLWSWGQRPERLEKQEHRRKGWQYAKPLVCFSLTESWCVVVAEERYRHGS